MITPELQDDVVRCVPFNGEIDYAYLAGLAQQYKHNTVKAEEAIALVKEYAVHLWRVYDAARDVAGGVVYLCKYAFDRLDLWTIDGYREDTVVKSLGTGLPYSYRATVLVSNFALGSLCKDLYTMHSAKNRAATILCRRAGFEIERHVETAFGQFVMLRKGK